MREADRIAKKVLSPKIARKVKKLNDERAKKLLPELRVLEEYMDNPEKLFQKAKELEKSKEREKT